VRTADSETNSSPGRLARLALAWFTLVLLLVPFMLSGCSGGGQDAIEGDSSAATPPAEMAVADVVVFVDPALETVIREEIGKRTGDIFLSDIVNVRWIHGSGEGIGNLEGIQYCTGLERLELDDNEIVDVSALAGLTHLEELSLNDNAIIDISPLADLTNLENLSLSMNEIVDISPLSGLANLTYLHLADNPIVHVSPLATLTQLEWLTLNYNDIVDIGSLSELPNLWMLQIADSETTDIDAILEFPAIYGLMVSGISQRDFERIVSTWPDIAMLAVISAHVTDISPVANLGNLVNLWLDENEIIDLSPLAGLVDLTQLDVSDNDIADISVLLDLPSLRDVILLGNSLDLTPGSQDMEIIEELNQRNVRVVYEEPE